MKDGYLRGAHPQRATQRQKDVFAAYVYEARVRSDTAPSTNEISRNGAVATRAALTAATPPATNVIIAKIACGSPVLPGKMPTPRAPMPRTVIGMVTDRRPNTRWTNHEPAITRIPMAAMDRSKIIADGLEDEAVGRAGPAEVADFVAAGAMPRLGHHTLTHVSCRTWAAMITSSRAATLASAGTLPRHRSVKGVPSNR